MANKLYHWMCSIYLALIIGFIDPPYSTREESGFVTVSVGILIAGIVFNEDFVVNLQTMDIAGIQNAAQGNNSV